MGRGGEETLKPKRQKLTNRFYVAVRMFNKRLQITLRELYRPTVTWDYLFYNHDKKQNVVIYVAIYASVLP